MAIVELILKASSQLLALPLECLTLEVTYSGWGDDLAGKGICC